jgi:tRNA threonylcarbamoyladenosine biosynthesis protein TsaB
VSAAPDPGIVLGFDTATAATAVAVLLPGGQVFEARHDPAPGERPGHATRLLGLVEEALAAAGARDVQRIAVGVGPGSFTGLRIGVATARALAQSTGAGLVGVSTLRALAAAAPADPGGAALAAIDARRGEAFAAAWSGNTLLMPPAALPPEELARAAAALPRPVLAVGDGAVRFRASLEAAGAAVPPDGDRLHRVSAAVVCRLGAEAEPGRPDAVVPDYLRVPDAEANRP